MNGRYFAYIRVSTVKQGEYGSSLAEQRDAIEAYAARHGLQIAEWCEERETAAKRGRRAFSALLERLKAGEASGLIMHKIDRGARNARDWADLGDLIDQGVDIRFVTDNFDLTSRGGRLSADIQAVIAADYVRNLRDEVKKGIYGRLKQGIYPFAAPIGYLNTGGGKAKAIDPVKSPLIRELFERYGTNTIGLIGLGDEFFQKGLRSRSGQPIRVQNLAVILHNPFYAGVIKIKTTGETFPGIHEPLVSVALFERVQAILSGKTVPKAKKHEFLFRQMIKCGNCDRRTLTGEWHKGRPYYRCHGRSCRGLASWRGDLVEKLALEKMAAVSFSHREMGDVGEMIEDYLKSQRQRRYDH